MKQLSLGMLLLLEKGVVLLVRHFLKNESRFFKGFANLNVYPAAKSKKI